MSVESSATSTVGKSIADTVSYFRYNTNCVRGNPQGEAIRRMTFIAYSVRYRTNNTRSKLAPPREWFRRGSDTGKERPKNLTCRRSNHQRCTLRNRSHHSIKSSRHNLPERDSCQPVGTALGWHFFWPGCNCACGAVALNSGRYNRPKNRAVFLLLDVISNL